MFDNIGGKIKALAQVICWIGIIASAIGGIFLMTLGEDTIFVGFLVLLLGCLFSWIGSFFTYGFGELIEKTSEIAKNTGIKINNSKDVKSAEKFINHTKNEKYANKIKCDCSSEIHNYYIQQIKYIGHNTPDLKWESNNLIGEKTLICNHCNSIVAYESDFVK